MTEINWYPGHMVKSLRTIGETMGLIDVAVYVLDARAPRSCINPDFRRYIEKLPTVYVLNKADLADRNMTERWKKVLSSNGNIALSADSTVSGASGAILSAITSLCSGVIERKAARGVRAAIRAMVLGVPNTGKSTLINNLIGKGKAVTGNKAGVTRGKQWFRVSDRVELMDTPGTLYPKLSDPVTARHLAYIGSIKDEVVDGYELAVDLFGELKTLAPAGLSARYGFDPTPLSGDEGLEAVAASRAFLLKGGAPDVERAAAALIDDFRKGRLGKITLDGAEKS